MIQKFKYDTNQFPFRELFSALIGNYNLEHLSYDYLSYNLSEIAPGLDNNSYYHQLFYKNMHDSPFMYCYNNFIGSQIKDGERLIFQKYPTLRISFPNGKSVAAYHVDSEYNHPVEEVNIWLPFTDAHDTNSIYIESEPGKKDYKPQIVAYGEYIMFEGGILSHGNEVNKTGLTRISIDMRVILSSKYKPSDLKGIAYGKVRNTEGENAYYSIM